MFRFTIREAMLVMTLCAVSGAWWGDHRLLAGSLARSERQREKFELMANILLHFKHPADGEMCNPPRLCGNSQPR